MKIRFSKMHGLGNDFVLVDQRNEGARPWSELAPKLLDRRFGVGGDQLLVLATSKIADVQMMIFERDGLQSEMCGNGIRCAALYLKEQGDARQTIAFETLAGRKTVEVKEKSLFTVDMGPPHFDTSMWAREIQFGNRALKLHGVSMGNPHAVIFVDERGQLEWVTELGAKIETHPWFPFRTNVEFVWVRDAHHVEARVWERSAGETLACGTGACALASAAIREKRSMSPTRVALKGGVLEITWVPGGPVMMTGPATHVFSSEVEL